EVAQQSGKQNRSDNGKRQLHRQRRLVPKILDSPLVPTLLFVSHSRYFSNNNSPARLVAFTTALISVTRSFPSSSSRIPSIVHPAGVVTESFSSAGWSPVSSTTLAEPFIICAASSVETSRGNPTFTPASASDSRMMYANAGPLAESPVTASMFFSSTTTVRPTASNIARATSRCSGPACAPRQIPVIPQLTVDGLFGIAR